MKEAALILFLRILALLPLSTTRRLGRLLARIASGRMRNTTTTNIGLCFPELDRAAKTQLVNDSLSHTLQTVCEAGAVWLWPAERCLALITSVEGLGLLQAAKLAGKGVLVLAPHLGNWEIMGLYLNVCGTGQSHHLYQPPDSPALDRLIKHGRSRTGAKLVKTDAKGVAELLKALRAGEQVAILPDQVPPANGGEFAPFFNVPALTMTLVHRLQQKTGAAVVMGFALRVQEGFRIVFRAPDPAIYAEDAAQALAALNRSVESLVREAPAQYQWEYKRFKRQPEGKPSPYADV